MMNTIIIFIVKLLVFFSKFLFGLDPNSFISFYTLILFNSYVITNIIFILWLFVYFICIFFICIISIFCFPFWYIFGKIFCFSTNQNIVIHFPYFSVNLISGFRDNFFYWTKLLKFDRPAMLYSLQNYFFLDMRYRYVDLYFWPGWRLVSISDWRSRDLSIYDRKNKTMSEWGAFSEIHPVYRFMVGIKYRFIPTIVDYTKHQSTKYRFRIPYQFYLDWFYQNKCYSKRAYKWRRHQLVESRNWVVDWAPYMGKKNYKKSFANERSFTFDFSPSSKSIRFRKLSDMDFVTYIDFRQSLSHTSVAQYFWGIGTITDLKQVGALSRLSYRKYKYALHSSRAYSARRSLKYGSTEPIDMGRLEEQFMREDPKTKNFFPAWRLRYEVSQRQEPFMDWFANFRNSILSNFYLPSSAVPPRLWPKRFAFYNVRRTSKFDDISYIRLNIYNYFMDFFTLSFDVITSLSTSFDFGFKTVLIDFETRFFYFDWFDFSIFFDNHHILDFLLTKPNLVGSIFWILFCVIVYFLIWMFIILLISRVGNLIFKKKNKNF